MRESTATNTPEFSLQALKEESKVKPFAAHFTTKLEGVNSKLVCALSRAVSTCWDDHVA
jgi:hypothetical protein